MSSLSQRLREMQTPIDVEVADLSHLTLEALAHETMTFGQKHAGHLFSEARKDQEWVSFMVNRCGASTKLEHRPFLRFVELKVAQHESQQMPMPVIPQDSYPMNVTSAKAKHGGRQGQGEIRPPKFLSPSGLAGRRMGSRTRDVCLRDYDIWEHRDDHCDATEDAQHGECLDSGDPSLGDSERSPPDHAGCTALRQHRE